MEGVGEVYRMYRDGILVSDDEVALAFDPESLHRPVGAPGEYPGDPAPGRGGGGHRLPYGGDPLLTASSLYYPDRTYPRLVREAERDRRSRSLARFARWVEKGRWT